MIQLSVVPDMPPKWDGVPVTWSAWSTDRSTIIYHVPADALACRKCGAVDESAFSMGRCEPLPGATFTHMETFVLKSGKTYLKEVTVPAWPVTDLIAARCRHCGVDHVTDRRTGEYWELDATDYTPAGSWA